MNKFQFKDLLKNKWFLLIVSIKAATILLWMPPELKNSLIPFITGFLTGTENPWEFSANNESSIFPYPSGMLYLLAVFLLPKLLFPGIPEEVQLFLIQLPTLIADIFIYYFLLKTFPDKKIIVTLVYFCSPIIYLAAYIYPNHDLLPTAVLLITVFSLIRKKHLLAGLFLGIGLSLKLPVIFAVPLFLIYIFRSHKRRDLLKFCLAFILTWIVTALPFLFTPAYQAVVFQNEEQLRILDIYIQVGFLKVYIAPLALAILYIQFLRFEKVNADLLYTFMTMLYFAFVVFIPPMPHWYGWPVVFASILFIRSWQNRKNVYLFLLLNISYLSYFSLFYPEMDRNLFSILHIDHIQEYLPNLIFTLLEGIILFSIWVFYKFGLSSNSLYRVNQRPAVIGIGGDSGAGKTTLTKGIMKLFGSERVLIVEGDGDHKWERGHVKWQEYTHLNPKANYLHEQAATLETLKSGSPIKRIEYDHSTGKFTSPKRIDPNDFIVMCGLHTLYLAKTRKVIDLKIYVDTEERLRRHWKIIRDCAERGYSPENVLKQIETRMEDAEKYIYPQKKFADLIFRQFTDDDFEIGCPVEDPLIKLEVLCDANLSMEKLITELEKKNINFFHDYDEELNHQYFILSAPIDEEKVYHIANRCVGNLDEVTRGQIIEWGEGYEAFIQLMILITISEKMKEV